MTPYLMAIFSTWVEPRLGIEVGLGFFGQFDAIYDPSNCCNGYQKVERPRPQGHANRQTDRYG
jgi:hypothetical protein